eukprot:GFUD01028475.1.p1 GENE.GFUD01028475.1~~GFUD01028475.1.p1  ORF type:complete len:1309 (+),score=423.19 GFUD01028475.1:182-4108(+)
MNIVTCFKESGFPLLPEITIKNEQNQVVVRKVPADGEFAKFGVKEGDVIESVNGISFKGFDNNKVFSTLSVLTGDLTIVFGAGVKESVAKSKRKPKENSINSAAVIKEEPVNDRTKISEIKVEKEPKPTSKRKKATTSQNSVNNSPNETNIDNEHESILDNSKKRKSARGKGKKEVVLEKSKEEVAPSTSLEECPECDQKFSGIEALSEHYTEVHTVISEEDDATPLPPVSPVKKNKRKSSKRESIKSETISVSEHFTQNELLMEKPRAQELGNDNGLTVQTKDGSQKTEEIQQLHDKMKSMKDKFANFKKDRIELVELKKKMESNRDLEISLKSLKDEVDKKYQEMSDLKSMVLNTENQLENERVANKKEKDRNRALADEIKKLKKNQIELLNKFKESESKNREYIAKECMEVDETNDKTEQLKEMEKEILFLNSKVDQLSLENDSLVEETLKVARKEKEVLQNTIDEKIIEVESLKNEKSLSKMKIRSLEKGMDAFKTNAQEIQTKIASMNTERESENQELKDTVETQNNKIQECEKELKISNEKVHKYKRDVSKLLEKISRKEDVIDGLMKDKKVVDDDGTKKELTEKKLKTYQDTILQKSGIISKLEEENQKLLKEKIENLPLTEEKKKCRFLEDNLRKIERQNRELNEKFRIIEIENEDKKIKVKIEHHQDVIKTNEIDNKLQELEKESAIYEQKIQKLTSEKENLEETLKNSTMEVEEKNLLNILKSDVKTLEATNELNLEKIISLEMGNEKYKSSKKDVDIVTLQEGIRDLERETEEFKLKYKDLEDENRDTLNDQMKNLTAMVHLKEKYAKLKEKKRELKDDFEEQNKIMEKLQAKNKILHKEVGHMSQLQVELKSLKQKIGSKTDQPEIVVEDVQLVSKWDRNDASDSSSDEQGDDEDWKFVNDTIEEIIDKTDQKKSFSDVSDDENDFDTTKFIELAKNKASEKEALATEPDNVILRLNNTPKVNATVRKAISDLLETKETENEREHKKVPNEDLDIRRTFGDKLVDRFSLNVKNNRKVIDEKVDRRVENGRVYPEAGRQYERNSKFSRRGRDVDVRHERERIFKGPYRRERNYNERNSFKSTRYYPNGSYSNFKAAERDKDAREPRERKVLLPSPSPYQNKPSHERRNVNDPRRWRQEVSYGPRQNFMTGEKPLPNDRNFSKLEQAETQTAKILQNESRTERSPSMDKPSTSTVNKSYNAANLVCRDEDALKANEVVDINAQIKNIRNTQTEAKFEERNVDLTENYESDQQLKKHSLEDGEIQDILSRKRLKTDPLSPSIIPKFRLSKESRSEIRSL